MSDAGSHDAWQPAASSRARRQTALLFAVFLATCIAQSQSLVLSFQLDDYFVLRAPLELFRGARETSLDGIGPWAVRFVLWALYAALDLLPGAPNEVVHRMLGLGLHVGAALLVARVALRAGAGMGAALFAALLFGVGGGAAQAFTWSSAWGDLLGAFFGLLAAERLLAARSAGARRGPRLRVAGAGALLLALLSKETLLPLAPALLLGLFLVPGPKRARSARRAEASAVLVPLVVAILVRWLYLGSLGARYGGFEPSLGQFLAAPGRALELLAKALVPFNGDPLISDLWATGLGSGPFTPLLRDHGPTPVAFALVLATLSLAFFYSTRRGLVALGLLLLAWGCALPSGLLGVVPAHNGVARTLYMPLVFVCLALGLAFGSSARGPWTRRLGLGLALVWLAAVAPLSFRVGHLERVASNERVAYLRTANTLLQQSPEPRDRLVLLVPPAAFAGISQIGPHVTLALSPPFRAEHGYELQSVADRLALARALAAARGEGARTWLLGPADDLGLLDQSRGPLERRRARMPLLRSLGFEAAPPTAPVLAAEGSTARARFDPAPAPLGLAGWTLVYEGPVPVGELEILWIADGMPAARQRPTLAGGAAGSSLHLAVPADSNLRLASSIDALVFDPATHAPQRVHLGGRPPELTVPSWPELVFAPSASGPVVDVELPPGVSWPVDVRAELEFQLAGGLVRLYLHGRLPEGAASGQRTGPVPVQLGRVADAPSPPLGPLGGLAFGEFAQALETLLPGGIRALNGLVRWRLELVHPDGTAAASSPTGSGRYRTSSSG